MAIPGIDITEILMKEYLLYRRLNLGKGRGEGKYKIPGKGRKEGNRVKFQGQSGSG
jgi:hypothetical protein